jgi:hypothetical protein
MQMRNSGMPVTLPAQVLSINPNHVVLTKLNTLRYRVVESGVLARISSHALPRSQSDEASQQVHAQLVAKQLFANAQLAAGLVDDPKYASACWLWSSALCNCRCQVSFTAA